MCWVWWHVSIILALLRLRKENCCELKTSLGDKARSCQERKKKKRYLPACRHLVWVFVFFEVISGLQSV